MSAAPTLDELWRSTPAATETFSPSRVAGLPEPARRYLEHAIAPGARLASAVRLSMHGEIKLQGWLPFTAEQVIRWDRGLIWRARVRARGVTIRGFDRLVDGVGEMRWRILGLIPVMSAAGPDITRSGAGRMAAESMWLPSVLCRPEVTWTARDAGRAQAAFTVAGEEVAVELAVDGAGRVESTKLRRWGNPGGEPFRYEDFGGLAAGEATFDGYTIPTQLRAGWYVGEPRFESEGEFFRCKIDRAELR
jgi:hypothetical protein